MGTDRSNPATRHTRSSAHSGKRPTPKAIRVRSPQSSSASTSISPSRSVVQNTQRSPQTHLKPTLATFQTLRQWPWQLLWAIVLVLGAASGVAGAGWLSVQLIVNPQAFSWLTQSVPGWENLQSQEEPAKSLDTIQAELRQKGLTPRDVITLGRSLSRMDGRTPTTDVLLPVSQTQPNCQSDCDRLVELRVYQTAVNPSQDANKQKKYYLATQLPITGVEELFAIAPLVESAAASRGSSRNLPLTVLNRYEAGQAPQGIWLSLRGNRTHGNETIAYGQVLYYHLKSQHLSSKLQWASPFGEEPVWKEVTGGGSPELIVNQTIGLEPQFEIYQVQPQNFVQSPVALVPISLSTPVLDNPQYQSGLLLARNRLWSTSLAWLQGLKKRSPKIWSSTAQAQLDMIRWHAQATKTQAESSWASPSQQILANLVDGRWERATTVFTSSVEASQETIGLLKSDIGRIENRVRTALRFNPAKREIKAWGALLLAAQKDQTTAIAWLSQQPKTTAADMAYFQGLLQRLDPNFQDTSVSNSDRTSRIIGEVQPISQVKSSEWRYPKSSAPVQRNSQQTWYQVTVMAFHDGQKWQFAESGFTGTNSLTGDALWNLLGLQTSAIVQLLSWDQDGNQQTLWTSVKGLRTQNGQLQLLVAGDDFSHPMTNSESRPLALTEAALQWLPATSTTLSEWDAQHPAWREKALPELIQELQQVYKLPISARETWETLEQWGLGNWTGQTAYLTNSNQPDLILTIAPESVTTLAQTLPTRPSAIAAKPRTLIFSAAGKLLYSELSTDATSSFLAIANLEENQPTLIVRTGSRYRLLRWSTARQQFN